MSKTVRVAVTGAAGQISYSLLFRIASGEVFGLDTKVELNLLELPEVISAAHGLAMEMDDCAFSCLKSVNCYDDPTKAFEGVNWALLVGSRPRGKGMERSDLIKANGPIFVTQGKALRKAAKDVRIVVVGNPCNTNALIAQANCPEISKDRFSAMTALDENRSRSILAQKAGVGVEDVENIIIWGNHSSTMFPDFENALIKKAPLTQSITDTKWLSDGFITKVQNRGAEIIEARGGKSSAASAANACIDHVKNLLQSSSKTYSAAITSDDNPYGIPSGLIFSMPLKNKGSLNYEIIKGVKHSDFAKAKIKASADELLKEKSMVADFLKP